MNSTSTTTQALGFNGRFYSLWNVTDCSIHNELFDQTITWYTRVRKVSKYDHIALKKFPGLSILPILDGRQGNFVDYGEKVYNNINRFRCGKYAGELIEAHLDDMQYIKWYYGIAYDEHKKYIHEVLMNNGCEEIKNIIKINGFKVKKTDIILPEEIARRNEMNSISNNINTTIEIKHWLNENGEYIGENKNIIYKFDSYKECYYDGFTYYKPAINGVGKNVKGKSIKITNYMSSVDNFGKMTINITNFEVVKQSKK